MSSQASLAVYSLPLSTTHSRIDSAKAGSRYSRGEKEMNLVQENGPQKIHMPSFLQSSTCSLGTLQKVRISRAPARGEPILLNSVNTLDMIGEI